MGIFDFMNNSPESKLGKCFDKAVESAINASGGDPLFAGVLTYSAIAKTYSGLKQDRSMIQQCGLSESEYLQLLEKVLTKKGREYISNWDQMRDTSQREYDDRMDDIIRDDLAFIDY